MRLEAEPVPFPGSAAEETETCWALCFRRPFVPGSGVGAARAPPLFSLSPREGCGASVPLLFSPSSREGSWGGGGALMRTPGSASHFFLFPWRRR